MKTLAALLLIGASAACAAVDFEKDIRPVLRERCVKRGHRKVDAGEPRRLAEEVEGARASTEDWALGTEHFRKAAARDSGNRLLGRTNPRRYRDFPPGLSARRGGA